jgi:hypothetical protein
MATIAMYLAIVLFNTFGLDPLAISVPPQNQSGDPNAFIG